MRTDTAFPAQPHLRPVPPAVAAPARAHRETAGYRLVGREAQRARINGLLAATAAGRPGALVVCGPPGAGHTRMLQEAGDAAERHGCTVLRRRSHTVDGDLVRDLLALTGGADQPLRPAGTVPCLVTVDDVHRLTPDASARMSAACGGAVGWLIAVRPTADDRGAAEGLGRVDLPPLSRNAALELAAEALDARPDRALHRLVLAAGGNPLLITELVAGLREEGRVTVDGATARLTGDHLPRRLHAGVGRWLAALSQQARHLVQAAAVLGRTFVLQELADMQGSSSTALLGPLEEALIWGLLEYAGEGLAFRHQLAWRSISECLPAAVCGGLRRDAELVRRGPALVHRAGVGPAGPWAAVEPVPELTEIEYRIAALVAEGLTNRQVARRVTRSPHTVNYHLRHIFRKLGVNSRVELTKRLCQAS